jgi:hypothetical protein
MAGCNSRHSVHAVCQAALRRDDAQLLCRFQKATQPFYGNRLCIANRNGYQAFPFEFVDCRASILYRLKRLKTLLASQRRFSRHSAGIELPHSSPVRL